MSTLTLIAQGRQRVRSLLRRIYHRLPFSMRRGLNTRRRAAQERPLHATLPLPLPETVHIDPTNLCNFRCVFCPTADKPLLASVGRPNGSMDYELFVKIIDDLCRLVRGQGRRLATLHLYKDGEPLVHRRFPEMAAYAKRSNVAAVVSTTTNGALLTPALADRIIDSGLDQIRVSVVHVDDRVLKELTQTKVDYEKIRANVAYIYREKRRRGSPLRVIAKTNDCGLTPEQKEKLERDFSPIADMVGIDTLMGWSLSEVKDFTLGVPVTTGMDSRSPLRARRVCPEPFSRLAVNFDGQVSVCCVDWSFGTIVGDLKTQSFEEIWNGERLRSFRLAHLTGRRDTIPACAKCQYMLGAPLSRDLDGHVEELISIYSATGPSDETAEPAGAAPSSHRS